MFIKLYYVYNNQKQHNSGRCPSAREWINEFWNIPIRECYSGIKKEQAIDTCNVLNECQNHAE